MLYEGKREFVSHFIKTGKKCHPVCCPEIDISTKSYYNTIRNRTEGGAMTVREQLEQLDTCASRLTALYGEWAKRNKMSYNAMVVLDCLNREKECTQKQITDAWMIPKQTVNTIVKDLERKGYIGYEQIEGKKEKRIFLTEEGKAYASDCLKGMYRLEERAWKHLDKECRTALVESNLAYVRAFEEELYNEK